MPMPRPKRPLFIDTSDDSPSESQVLLIVKQNDAIPEDAYEKVEGEGEVEAANEGKEKGEFAEKEEYED